MEEFAKIFIVGNHQVLVFFEYDTEEEKTIISHITIIDGITVNAKVTLSGKDQDILASKYLTEYTQDKAEKFEKEMSNLLQ